MLHTIRDVIRFHNSFYLLAKAYKDQSAENEVCFQDLFFLELLRYRYFDVYTILCNKPFILLQVSDYEFSLDKDYKKTLQEYLDNTQIEIVSDILEYLFRNDRDKANAIYSLRTYFNNLFFRLEERFVTVERVWSLGEKVDTK